MTIRLINVHQLETLYLCYGVKGQPGVIWGHRGQKVIFTKNATSTDYMAWLCNSCIYIHKLETLYSIHGVKVNLGSHPPANIMRLCPDLFPDLVTLPAQPQGTVSYSFLLSFFLKLGGLRLTYFFLAISFFLLLLLSFFLTICFFFHMLDWISTKLGQNDQWVSGYKSYALFDLKGHVRVTGGKKVIFTENASPPTCFIGF